MLVFLSLQAVNIPLTTHQSHVVPAGDGLTKSATPTFLPRSAAALAEARPQVALGHAMLGVVLRHLPSEMLFNQFSSISLPCRGGRKKGVIAKGVFSLEESLESLNSLESLENAQMLLCFPQSGGSLESLNSLNSLESLERDFSEKTPFPKDPFFRTRPWESTRASWAQTLKKV